MDEIEMVPLVLVEGADGLKEAMVVQAVIVKKGDDCAGDIEAAKGKVPGDLKTTKVDETTDSYRFRQVDPSRFNVGSFRSKEVNACVTLVLGKLRD